MHSPARNKCCCGTRAKECGKGLGKDKEKQVTARKHSDILFKYLILKQGNNYHYQPNCQIDITGKW